jgi:hypothetical protein
LGWRFGYDVDWPICSKSGAAAQTHLPQSLEAIDKAIDGIREVGQRTGHVTVKELISPR